MSWRGARRAFEPFTCFISIMLQDVDEGHRKSAYSGSSVASAATSKDLRSQLGRWVMSVKACSTWTDTTGRIIIAVAHAGVWAVPSDVCSTAAVVASHASHELWSRRQLDATAIRSSQVRIFSGHAQATCFGVHVRNHKLAYCAVHHWTESVLALRVLPLFLPLHKLRICVQLEHTINHGGNPVEEVQTVAHCPGPRVFDRSSRRSWFT